jgi:hypothetical protein
LSQDISIDKKYKIIINAAGVCNGNTIKNNPEVVISSTKEIDNIVLEHVTKNNSKLINISSAAVYLNSKDAYTIAKKKAEQKHRELKNKFIVDIRIFGFFSRFSDLSQPFFMNEVAQCLINNKEFVTTKDDFIKDYVSPFDLCKLIGLCINSNFLNTAIDAYSKQPVGKFELLNSIDFRWKIKKNLKKEVATGNKKTYFHKEGMPALKGYAPKFSSKQTLLQELRWICSEKK